MWLNNKNINKEIEDKSGTLWFFRVWHDHINGIYFQRIFFWSDNEEKSGVIELKDDQTLHISKIKDRMLKIAKNEDYRNRFSRELIHPIEENYRTFVPFD